ncbi:MAG: UbiD family decarboxylase [Actinobacteria bacterium]|nr:UbiD family decarboxylase [Actinomycetota bacterium]
MTDLNDLRDYLDALNELGDLRVIDREVDPTLELGATIRLSYERRAPAPLFTRVSGAQNTGCRILGAPAALSSVDATRYARVALSVGLDADATAQQILEHLSAATLRPAIQPVVVDSGACQQHVLLGDRASLADFPKPLLHEGDGGPYVNTWGTIVARTPNGQFTSWSIARIMYLDDTHMTGLVAPGQHIHSVWSQWQALGQPMPYALVQGGHPAIPFVSGMPLPDGVEEVGYLGALLGRPVELVRCQTNDLLVPADAEIVIEGRLSIGRDATEGPMGEYAGYQPGETSLQPVYTIDAITHRDNPIWPAVAEGEPVDEYHTVTGITGSADCLGALRAAGLPVTAVWAPPEMAMHAMVITVAQQWRDGLPGVGSEELTRRIFDVLRTRRFSHHMPRFYVLDDDIDPADLSELVWALATRVHPTARQFTDCDVIVPLIACYTDEERHHGRAARTVHDALQPAPEGRWRRAGFDHIYPDDVRHRVLASWPE